MPDTKASYDTWHARQALGEESAEKSFDPWHQTVARRLPDLNGKKVLEIGCGRGDFAIRLAQQFPTAAIIAVDFSDKAIEIARAQSGEMNPGVTFQVEDAENLRLPERAFDQVISCECLEHVPHPSKMAREIWRVL